MPDVVRGEGALTGAGLTAPDETVDAPGYEVLAIQLLFESIRLLAPQTHPGVPRRRRYIGLTTG
ncbi:MAG: hypothetical protein IPK07_23635 [Deltaproteobacteria bacterium]|nr:hypothetical protein [Deltaproteobacteria bacterium]